MRFFLSTVFQETNSFSPLASGIAQYRREKLLEGDAIASEVRGSNLEIAGMLEQIAQQFPGAEVVTGVYAWTVASGPLTDEALEQLAERLLAPLRRLGPFDAVLLSMHGSLGSQSCHDCEGELLARVRLLIGPAIPLAISLDSHAALSAQMLRHANVVVGYRTYPHVDMAETGRRTVTALANWLDGGRIERVLVRRWRAIIPVDNAQTDFGPIAELLAGLNDLEREAGTLTASVFCTHPWFDTAEQGVTLIAYSRPDLEELVGKRMEQLLKTLWERRAEFLVICPEPAIFFRGRDRWLPPVAAIDAGDITTAGSPGDSTVMLRAALAAPPSLVLLPLVDPETVDRARAMGAGQAGDFFPGNSGDDSAYNARTPVRAEVLRLTDTPLSVKGASFGGITLELGLRALLRIGSVQLLVMRHASLFHDPELWRSVGIEPASAEVVVQKSHKLFRPAYAGITRSVVAVDTPGCTDRKLARLPYRRVVRPIFPLDPANDFAVITEL